MRTLLCESSATAADYVALTLTLVDRAASDQVRLKARIRNECTCECCSKLYRTHLAGHIPHTWRQMLRHQSIAARTRQVANYNPQARIALCPQPAPARGCGPLDSTWIQRVSTEPPSAIQFDLR